MAQSGKFNRRELLQSSAVLCTTLLPAAFARPDTPQATTPPASSAALGALMVPGISEALAHHRARTVSQVRYRITLDITQRDQAAGTVGIEFHRDGVDDLILDFRGKTVDSMEVNQQALESIDWHNGHIRVPADALRPGKNALTARFTTPVSPSGTALLRFDDATDASSYLYTLLVPCDAHLLFPCFDQPDLKARIRWIVNAPEQWTVIANTRLASKTTQSGNATWTFNPTPPIPVYATSIAAGPWKAFQTGRAGQQPITLFARASRAAELDVDAFVATNRDTVAWLARWLETPFPYEKLDLIVVPAFPFGGMEHVGAVFYNENGTIFRERPTLSQRINRDQAIYHELSHQWFGDYVTMQWFDDLWLKEGFSTFIASYVQAALQPATEPWKTFYIRLKPSAYNTDASAGTNPLWQKLDNLNQAGSNYGPIVYNKAPSIIRQLAFLLGDDVFRRGLQRFLRQHAHGNATWRDLLGALEQASNTSLTQFGERWILQSGLPRIRTDLQLEGGRIRRLTLIQQPENEAAGMGPWPMKLQLRLGYRDRDDRLLPIRFDQANSVIAAAEGLPAPDYVWANDGDYGYGLFELESRSRAWIMDHIGEIKDNLLRAMLWGALWDEVRECRWPALSFARRAIDLLPSEPDEQLASFVLGRAATAVTHYAAEQDVSAVFPVWEQFLAARAQDAELTYGMRKDALDALARSARSAEGLEVLRGYLSGKLLLDGSAIPQVSRWAMITQLLARRAPDADALYDQEVSKDRSPDSARTAFVARAAKADPAIKRDYFRRYLEDKNLSEGWALSSFTAFNSPGQERLTLPYLREALEQLESIKASRSIAFLPSWINGFVRGCTSRQALDTLNQFLADRPRLASDIRRMLLEARDDVSRTIRVREFGSKGFDRPVAPA